MRKSPIKMFPVPVQIPMYVYVCMYVCMYVRMYVCMYVCMHACMHGMYVCLYIYKYIYTHMHTYTHIYIYIWLTACLKTCTFHKIFSSVTYTLWAPKPLMFRAEYKCLSHPGPQQAWHGWTIKNVSLKSTGGYQLPYQTWEMQIYTFMFFSKQHFAMTRPRIYHFALSITYGYDIHLHKLLL